jgi:hypothetical protein
MTSRVLFNTNLLEILTMSNKVTEPPKPKLPLSNDFEVHAKFPRVGEVKLTLYQETWDKVSQSLQNKGFWVLAVVLFGLFGVQSNFSLNPKSQMESASERPKPVLGR